MVYPGNRTLKLKALKPEYFYQRQPDAYNQLAKVELSAGDAEINRQDLQSMGIVSARLDNSDLGTVMPAIQKRLPKTLACQRLPC
jgi:Cu/Ag efflux pump CusA